MASQESWGGVGDETADRTELVPARKDQHEDHDHDDDIEEYRDLAERAGEWAAHAAEQLARAAWRERNLLAPLYAGIAATAGAATIPLTEPAAWIPGTAAVAATVITYGHGRWRDITAARQAYRTGMTGLLGAWTALAVHLGIGDQAVMYSWPALVAVGWALRWSARQPKPEATPDPPPVRVVERVNPRIEHLRKVWPMVAAGLGCAGMKVVDHHEVSTFRFTVTVELGFGQVVDNLSTAAERKRWEAALRLPVGMLRQVTAVSGDSGLALFHFQTGQPFGGAVAKWNESLAPKSALDPFQLGADETGERASMRLMTEEGMRNTIVGGSTGAGKTNFLRGLGRQAVGTGSFIIVVIDLKSGGELLGPLLPITTIPAMNRRDATLAMRAVASLVQPGGGRGPAKRRGEDVWIPTPDRPAVLVICDEVRLLFGSEYGQLEAQTAGVEIATLGRSLGVNFAGGGQQINADAVPGTLFRGQMHNRLAFRMEDRAGGAFLLEDWTRLDVSALDVTGTCYFSGKEGTPSIPTLTDRWSQDDVWTWALRNRDLVPGFDSYSGELVGGVPSILWNNLPPEMHHWLPTASGTLLVPGYAAQARQAAPVPAPAPEPERDPEAVRAVTEIDATIDKLLGVPSGTPLPMDIAEQAARTGVLTAVVDRVLDNESLEALCRTLEAAGPGGASRSGIERAIGRSKSWTAARLAGLAALEAAYTTGQGPSTAWHAAIRGAELRSAAKAADAGCKGRTPASSNSA